MTGSLAERLRTRIATDRAHFHAGNVDTLRYPSRDSLLARARRYGYEHAMAVLHKAGIAVAPRRERDHAASQVASITKHLEELEWLDAKLGDEASRELLVALLAFRGLGARRVKLPLNNDEFWRARELVAGKLRVKAGVGKAGMLGELDEYDLMPLGIPIRLEAHALNILNTFVLEQYRLHRPTAPLVEARRGDVVVDGGACWGDTALYFAHKVGDVGTVVAYEFVPDNLAILQRNLAMNPQLAPRIRIARNAIWSASGESLGYTADGSGSRVQPGQPMADQATTARIDDVLQAHGVPRVDFIKLDIEGAEMHALRGATGVIGQFRPRLAVSVYHQLEHLWEAAQLIDGLGLGYRFYLDHFTIHAEETVLFAIAPEG